MVVVVVTMPLPLLAPLMMIIEREAEEAEDDNEDDDDNDNAMVTMAPGRFNQKTVPRQPVREGRVVRNLQFSNSSPCQYLADARGTSAGRS